MPYKPELTISQFARKIIKAFITIKAAIQAYIVTAGVVGGLYEILPNRVQCFVAARTLSNSIWLAFETLSHQAYH